MYFGLSCFSNPQRYSLIMALPNNPAIEMSFIFIKLGCASEMFHGNRDKVIVGVRYSVLWKMPEGRHETYSLPVAGSDPCVGAGRGSPLATVCRWSASPRAICSTRFARFTDATGGYSDVTLRVFFNKNKSEFAFVFGLHYVDSYRCRN